MEIINIIKYKRVFDSFLENTSFLTFSKFRKYFGIVGVERSGPGGRISSKVSSTTLAPKFECKSKSTTGRRVQTFPAGDRHPQVNCHHSHGSRDV